MNSLNLNQTLDHDRVDRLLKKLDLAYTPPLSTLLDIRDYAAKLVEHATILIADLDGSDIGIAAMYANDLTAKRAFLTTIGVLPDFRGFGIGSRMLEALIEIAQEQGMKTILLEVHPSNTAAMRLYHKYSFVKTGHEEKHSYENSLFMMKQL